MALPPKLHFSFFFGFHYWNAGCIATLLNSSFLLQFKQKPTIILLDCSKLQLGRGRLDDSVTAFRRRLEIFRQLSLPMLKAMDNIGRLTIVSIYNTIRLIFCLLENNVLGIWKHSCVNEKNMGYGNYFQISANFYK